MISYGSYALDPNGAFGGTAIYIGLDSGTGFDKLVSSLGGFWNYAPQKGGDSAAIEALDEFSFSLGAFDLEALAPISTPGGFNEFTFCGIDSDAADIKSTVFGGNYIVPAGTADCSAPPSGDVPLPATAPLLAGVMALMGLVARRKARATA